MHVMISHSWLRRRSDLQAHFTMFIFTVTVILQIFGIVLFSVISVVNGFTEIKKTPKVRKMHGVIATASTDTEI